MPDVFINYRTSDGKEIAYRVHEELTRRFGEGAAFLAAKSIPKGTDYAEALDRGVRRSEVLLALIGPRWLDEPDRNRPEGRALDAEHDWVRREIEEAFACGLVVLPVLLGRRAEQLDAKRLPESIARLAECQYLRFELRTAEHDLKQIGDELARIVPRLGAADRDAGNGDGASGAAAGAGLGPDGGDAGDVHGFGNVSLGDGREAMFHTGTGAQFRVDGLPPGAQLGNRYGETHISGDTVHGDSYGGDRIEGEKVGGVQVNGDGAVLGDGAGSVAPHFGPARRRRADER
ncbi:toll/interleukin-1 receptor domain-containing protein [Streptomyces triticirhizae]|uniref:Toll/interleukin-1 receptor domain-containing protein n=1 Tax=Streptomyces triticirhizae TaxID=2483353 RepID=A0A3M2LD64_9ACTN|nr:toll/interleukin-1 receptor domain-containing protein [Streptomyces triticirhizae]RMI34543.1 toll/interleukin-1 receptor domain-containing protein [Streptomyces triticirhizae]